MHPIAAGLWTTLHREYGFTVDVAADAANAKCVAHYDGLTPETDALKIDWAGRAWMNPPYNPKGSVRLWLEKALEQASRGVFVVALVPMSSSVAWFNDLVVPYAEWHTFRGRISFEDPLAGVDDDRTSPKQDNLLAIFNPGSHVVGHAVVRDARTGERLWTRPDLCL